MESNSVVPAIVIGLENRCSDNSEIPSTILDNDMTVVSVYGNELSDNDNDFDLFKYDDVDAHIAEDNEVIDGDVNNVQKYQTSQRQRKSRKLKKLENMLQSIESREEQKQLLPTTAKK